MKAALSIFLVGMMGAGKSTVGVRLARRLNRAFIDIDRELESRLGVDIPTVFDLEGEEGFRRREAQLIDELTATEGLVLATGGGAVLRPENRQVLSARGLVVYLRATPADLWQRLRRDKHRPLLRADDPRQRVFDLVEQRDPFYMEIADLVVSTGRQPVDQAVESIIGWLSHPDCAERAQGKVLCSK
jgi:shikimate kinase